MAEGFNETLLWTFGLVNSAGKYLTGEKFQDKVVANGVSMKKKQIWTLVRVDETTVALKNSLGKFLTADIKGKLDCSGENIGDGQKFSFKTEDDGRVAIKSVAFGRYVGGSGDDLNCYDQTVDNTNLYMIHLAIHPQINLRNVNRKTYVHLKETDKPEECYLDCKEEIPWGYDAMLILEYHSGRYAIRAANTKYLRRDGELVDELDDNSLYTLVFRQAQVAFRDCKGSFLTAVGHSAKITTRKNTIGKDELFLIEDSHPQVRLIASNGKYVSIREGVEVRANHTDVKDSEIFQMEAVDRSDMTGNVKWAFRSNNKMYWKSGATITSEGVDFTPSSAQFEVEWMGALVALKADNGKYITVTSNGQLSAKSADMADTCKFVLEFINRPIIVLRGGFGFVGTKGSSGTLECNRSQYDVFGMTCDAGTYHLRSVSGKFWKIEEDRSMSINGEKPTDFFLELRAHTRMCIVDSTEKYLKGQQNGNFTATGSSVEPNTLWEY